MLLVHSYWHGFFNQNFFFHHIIIIFKFRRKRYSFLIFVLTMLPRNCPALVRVKCKRLKIAVQSNGGRLQNIEARHLLQRIRQSPLADNSV